MRAFRFLSLAILSALVATSAAVYAQDEKQQEDKPKQEEPKRQDEARPPERRDEMKTPRQEEAKPSKQEKNEQKQMEKQEHQGGQEAGHQQHTRPAGKSAHIPDDKFRTHFGRSHTFHAQRPQVVNGQPQIVYGGYTFVLIDEWPADWAYTDDCYIDYIDGEYFLFDVLHPGMRIALFVEM